MNWIIYKQLFPYQGFSIYVVDGLRLPVFPIHLFCLKQSLYLKVLGLLCGINLVYVLEEFFSQETVLTVA